MILTYNTVMQRLTKIIVFSMLILGLFFAGNTPLPESHKNSASYFEHNQLSDALPPASLVIHNRQGNNQCVRYCDYGISAINAFNAAKLKFSFNFDKVTAGRSSFHESIFIQNCLLLI